MNPIPLSAPNGDVYAYVCSRCHQVGGGSSVMYLPEVPGPIDVLVESSLRDAETCCLCRGCGTVCDLHRSQCEACSAWQQFGLIWYKIGCGWTNEPCPICHSVVSDDYCRSTPACVSCGDGHGGSPGGLCRDCHLDSLHERLLVSILEEQP